MLPSPDAVPPMSMRSSPACPRPARACCAVAAALVFAVAPALVAPASAQAPGAVEATADRPEVAFERARLLYDGRLFAAAERDFYEQCADRFRDAISDASPTLSPDVVSRRVTDLIAVQNGLWINWNRWGDREALERGLDLCEAIAFGESR